MTRNFLSCISALALVSLAAPALAQTTEGPAGSGEGGGIETVVVTATRRAEQLSKVPASISAFSVPSVSGAARMAPA